MQFFEALHMTGGSSLNSWKDPWKFSSDLFLLPAFCSPGVHSASNRNEYQGISLEVKFGGHSELTT
jgi:hypothetical protein